MNERLNEGPTCCRFDTRQSRELRTLYYPDQLRDHRHGDYVADGDGDPDKVRAAEIEIAHMIMT